MSATEKASIGCLMAAFGAHSAVEHWWGWLWVASGAGWMVMAAARALASKEQR